MSFLVFEGIDGSGKSTLIKALREELQKRSLPACFTKEPGGTFLGEKIRALLIEKTKSPPQPETEILLYYADRQQHLLELVKPALKKGQLLISDRYWASTFAYQCGGRKMKESFVSSIHDAVYDSSLDPDLWVLLDIPVEVSFKRLRDKQGDLDRFETETKDFYQRIRDYYLKLAQNSKSWLVLDGTQTTEKLLDQLLSFLEKKNLLEGAR